MKTMHLAMTALLAVGLTACASVGDNRGDRYKDGSYYSAPGAGQGDYYYAPEPAPYYYDPFFYDDPFFFGSSFGRSCWPSDFDCYSPWSWHPDLHHRHPPRMRAPAPRGDMASSFPDGNDPTVFPDRGERMTPRQQRGAPMSERPSDAPVRRSRRQSD